MAILDLPSSIFGGDFVPCRAYRLEPSVLLSFLVYWRGALPVTHVDDDPLGTAKFIFVICRAEVDRSGSFSTCRFQHFKLVLVVVGRKTDMINTRLPA